MHYWRGPRALGNRYVPWDRDSSHAQVREFNSYLSRLIFAFYIVTVNILTNCSFSNIRKAVM